MALFRTVVSSDSADICSKLAWTLTTQESKRIPTKHKILSETLDALDALVQDHVVSKSRSYALDTGQGFGQ